MSCLLSCDLICLRTDCGARCAHEDKITAATSQTSSAEPPNFHCPMAPMQNDSVGKALITYVLK